MLDDEDEEEDSGSDAQPTAFVEAEAEVESDEEAKPSDDEDEVQTHERRFVHAHNAAAVVQEDNEDDLRRLREGVCTSCVRVCVCANRVQR